MSAGIDLAAAAWVKSSYSGSDGGQCVEVCLTFAPDGVVPVRDSKTPEGPVLSFPVASFSSFIAAVKGNALSH
ncbi:DUF397 domain-containing protein [Streptomyces lunalinharesii]|uniref:DUF397 domain-containing protein n=1 Tax=Streptomyces lunalinharesii TaxID=333384 RepID=A0ABN3SVS8_9ACTN